MLDNTIVILKALKIEFRQFCIDFMKLAQIKSIFLSANFKLTDNSSYSCNTRRELVDAFYNSVDWKDEKIIQKFLKTIEYTLQLHYLSDEQKNYLLTLCTDLGFHIEENRILSQSLICAANLFNNQFPAGLPFGVPKPDFSITAIKGVQELKFELKEKLGLLTGKIYPCFTFKMLESLYGLNSLTNGALKRFMRDINQSDYEKDFFLKYAKKFNMAEKNVPVLIPQAWIQWHSKSKKNLRGISSSHKDELYRVDFVAFWNNERYVILVDDISHYGVKKDSYWYAHEESYAKRLKEDRKLRNENWQVFRVSNWELREDEKTQLILEDLRDFIDF